MRMLFQSAALVGLFAAQALAQSNTTLLDDLDNHNSTTAEDLESLTPEEFDELKKGNSTVLKAILSSNITLDEYNRTLTQLNTSSPQTLKINGVNYTLADLRNQNFTTPRPPISNSTDWKMKRCDGEGCDLSPIWPQKLCTFNATVAMQCVTGWKQPRADFKIHEWRDERGKKQRVAAPVCPVPTIPSALANITTDVEAHQLRRRRHVRRPRVQDQFSQDAVHGRHENGVEISPYEVRVHGE